MARRNAVLFASIGAFALAQSAVARAQVPGEDNAQGVQDERTSSGDSGDIIVTGSRIRQDGFNAPTPVTVVTAEQLNLAAPQGVAVGLNQLPQLLGSVSQTQTNPNTLGTGRGNFLNLRNVGINRTLILMDGVRVPPTTQNGQVDVDFVPELLISRVDVVTAGVSAVYGSDAVTGVVNFVLDKKFDGVRALAQQGISTYGDYYNYRLGVAVGKPFAGGRGHFLASLSYRDNDDALKTDRPLTAQRWFATGRYNAGATRPDGIVAGVAGSATNPYAFFRNATSSSTAINGFIVAGPPSLVGRQFSNTGAAVPFNRGTPINSLTQIGGDGQAFPEDGSLVGKNRIIQAFGRASFDLTDDLEIHVEGNLQDSKQRWIGSTDFGVVPIFSGNAFLDPAIQAILDNPALNAGNFATVVCGAGAVAALCLNKFPNDDVRLRQRQAIDLRAYSLKAGLAGKAFGDWNWELAYVFGRSRTDGMERSRKLQHFFAAVDAVRDPSGNVVCRATLVAPGALPGCVPFNPMVFGGHSQAAIDWIMGASEFTTISKTHDIVFNITGEPFSLWAGPVGVAVGAEYRTASLFQTSNSSPEFPFSTVGLRGVSNPSVHYGSTSRAHATGEVKVKEANAEINVPILAELPFAHSLTLAAAGRYTDYSTSGTVYTWKLGGTYEPIEQIRLRVTRSRDIRAPTLFDLYGGRTQARGAFTDIHCNCTSQSGLLTLTGGNPNLEPEIADTWTIGGIVDGRGWLPGFTASVDYYNLKITDAITNLSVVRINELCEESNGTSPICANINRPLPFSNRTVDNYPISILASGINSALLQTKGFDFEASYFRPIGQDSLMFRALGTYVLDFKTKTSSADPLIENAGFTSMRIPKFRGSASITYKTGSFSFFVQERFIGSMKTGPKTGTLSNGNSQPLLNHYEIAKLPKILYTDVTLKYNWDIEEKDIEMFLTVNNLFNKQPPIWPTTAIVGLTYPTMQDVYDVVGRMFTLGLRVKM